MILVSSGNVERLIRVVDVRQSSPGFIFAQTLGLILSTGTVFDPVGVSCVDRDCRPGCLAVWYGVNG